VATDTRVSLSVRTIPSPVSSAINRRGFVLRQDLVAVRLGYFESLDYRSMCSIEQGIDFSVCPSLKDIVYELTALFPL